jgi:hypothetical protein
MEIHLNQPRFGAKLVHFENIDNPNDPGHRTNQHLLGQDLFDCGLACLTTSSSDSSDNDEDTWLLLNPEERAAFDQRRDAGEPLQQIKQSFEQGIATITLAYRGSVTIPTDKLTGKELYKNKVLPFLLAVPTKLDI